jgi:hypothetical protein
VTSLFDGAAPFPASGPGKPQVRQGGCKNKSGGVASARNGPLPWSHPAAVMFALPALPALPAGDLLLALLRRLIACVCWRQAAAPPAPKRCLMRTEAALAHALRATLAESGLAAPDIDDAALFAWFARTHSAGGAPSHAKQFAAFRVQRSNTNDPTPLCRSEPKCLERRRPGRRARLEMVSAARAPPLRACAWPSPPNTALAPAKRGCQRWRQALSFAQTRANSQPCRVLSAHKNRGMNFFRTCSMALVARAKKGHLRKNVMLSIGRIAASAACR